MIIEECSLDDTTRLTRIDGHGSGVTIGVSDNHCVQKRCKSGKGNSVCLQFGATYYVRMCRQHYQLHFPIMFCLHAL